MENAEYYLQIQSLLESNQALWQATIIETEGSSPAKPGMKACVGSGEQYFGNLGGGEMEYSIISYIRSHKPAQPLSLSFSLSGQLLNESPPDKIPTSMICGGSASVFIEPLHKSEQLYIIGAGHCGRALAQLASLAGYFVTLIDNRSELIRAIETESWANRSILSDYSDISSLIGEPANSWLVIMTHGHLHDRQVLEQCLDLNCRYLGMIGSKTKVAETMATLMSKHISEESLAKVHAPIGLPIGSQTPFEIAISILAELISLRRAKP